MSKFGRMAEAVIGGKGDGRISWEEFRTLCRGRLCRPGVSILYRTIVHRDSPDRVDFIGNERDKQDHRFRAYEKDNPEGVAVAGGDTVLAVVDSNGRKDEVEMAFLEPVLDIMRAARGG